MTLRTPCTSAGATAALSVVLCAGAMTLVLPGSPAYAKGGKKGGAKADEQAGPKLSKKEQEALKKAKKRQKKFFDKGMAAYEEELWDDAIASFELAHEALATPRILFNIARVHENKGTLLKAIEYLERFVATAEEEEVRQEGQDILAVVKKKVAQTYATVKVTAAPEGAEVRLKRGDEDALSGTAPLERFVDPGAWTITVAKEGYDEWKEERPLEAGKELVLDIKLVDPSVRRAELAAEKARQKKEQEEAKRKADEERKAAAELAQARAEADAASLRNWIIVGAGGALLAAGAVSAVMLGSANEKVDELKTAGGTIDEYRTAQDDAESLALTTNVLLGVGALAAITGGVLMYLADPPPAAKPAAAASALEPALSIGAGPWGVAGSF